MALSRKRNMKLLMTIRGEQWLVAVAFAALVIVLNSGTAWAQPCQPLFPAAPFPIWGVDSAAGCGCGEVGWDARGMIPWQEFAQGEYVGHARTPHVPEYRIREGDVIAVYYRRTREEISRPYELQVGDRLRVELLSGSDTTAAAQGA